MVPHDNKKGKKCIVFPISQIQEDKSNFSNSNVRYFFLLAESLVIFHWLR